MVAPSPDVAISPNARQAQQQRAMETGRQVARAEVKKHQDVATDKSRNRVVRTVEAVRWRMLRTTQEVRARKYAKHISDAYDKHGVMLTDRLTFAAKNIARANDPAEVRLALAKLEKQAEKRGIPDIYAEYRQQTTRTQTERSTAHARLQHLATLTSEEVRKQGILIVAQGTPLEVVLHEVQLQFQADKKLSPRQIQRAIEEQIRRLPPDEADDLSRELGEANYTTEDIARGVAEEIREFQHVQRGHTSGMYNIDTYLAGRIQIIGGITSVAGTNEQVNLDGIRAAIARSWFAGLLAYTGIGSRNARLITSVGGTFAVAAGVGAAGVVNAPVIIAGAVAITAGTRGLHAAGKHGELQQIAMARALRGEQVKTRAQIRQEAADAAKARKKGRITQWRAAQLARFSEEHRIAGITERTLNANLIASEDIIARMQYDIGEVATQARVHGQGSLEHMQAQEDARYTLASVTALLNIYQTRHIQLFRQQNGATFEQTLQNLEQFRATLYNDSDAATFPADEMQKMVQDFRAQALAEYEGLQRSLWWGRVGTGFGVGVAQAAIMVSGYEVGSRFIAPAVQHVWHGAQQFLEAHHIVLGNVNTAPRTHVVDLVGPNNADIKVNLPNGVNMDVSHHLYARGKLIGSIGDITADGHGGYLVPVHVTDATYIVPGGTQDVVLDVTTSSTHAIDYNVLPINHGVYPDATGHYPTATIEQVNSNGGVAVTGTIGETGVQYNALGFNVTDATGHVHSMVVYANSVHGVPQIDFNPGDTAHNYLVSFDGQPPVSMSDADICTWTHVTQQVIAQKQPTDPNVINWLFGDNAIPLHAADTSGKIGSLTRIVTPVTGIFPHSDLMPPVQVDLTNTIHGPNVDTGAFSLAGHQFGPFSTPHEVRIDTPRISIGPIELVPAAHMGPVNVPFEVGISSHGVTVGMPPEIPGIGTRAYLASWESMKIPALTIAGTGLGLGFLRGAFLPSKKVALLPRVVGTTQATIPTIIAASIVTGNPATGLAGALIGPSFAAGKSLGSRVKKPMNAFGTYIQSRVRPTDQQKRQRAQQQQQKQQQRDANDQRKRRIASAQKAVNSPVRQAYQQVKRAAQKAKIPRRADRQAANHARLQAAIAAVNQQGVVRVMNQAVQNNAATQAANGNPLTPEQIRNVQITGRIDAVLDAVPTNEPERAWVIAEVGGLTTQTNNIPTLEAQIATFERDFAIDIPEYPNLMRNVVVLNDLNQTGGFSQQDQQVLIRQHTPGQAGTFYEAFDSLVTERGLEDMGEIIGAMRSNHTNLRFTIEEQNVIDRIRNGRPANLDEVMQVARFDRTYYLDNPHAITERELAAIAQQVGGNRRQIIDAFTRQYPGIATQADLEEFFVLPSRTQKYGQEYDTVLVEQIMTEINRRNTEVNDELTRRGLRGRISIIDLTALSPQREFLAFGTMLTQGGVIPNVNYPAFLDLLYEDLQIARENNITNAPDIADIIIARLYTTGPNPFLFPTQPATP